MYLYDISIRFTYMEYYLIFFSIEYKKIFILSQFFITETIKFSKKYIIKFYINSVTQC